MMLSHVRTAAMLEIAVMLLQLVGLASLCLTRLVPGTAWGWRAKVILVLALVGLGVAGALCGRHDSEFALFAGVTMTVLLIGITAGAGTSGPAAALPSLKVAKTKMAA